MRSTHPWRIFESIVEEVHQSCAGLDGWSENEYNQKRFNEKIEYIEKMGMTVIPAELNGVRSKLYGVLSKGIHRSAEEECRELFSYMKFAIDIFLDSKVEERERQKRINELNKVVGNVKD